MVKLIAVLCLLGCALVSGCGGGPDGRMRGTYTNENQQATLEVTSNKMVVSGGPLTISAEYRVLNVTGTDVTVELTASNAPKGEMVVTVRDNSLVIKNNFLFGGTWIRK